MDLRDLKVHLAPREKSVRKGKPGHKVKPAQKVLEDQRGIIIMAGEADWNCIPMTTANCIPIVDGKLHTQ